MWKFFSVLVLFGAVFIKNSHSLQCWRCSSDIDSDCADRFNHTLDYLRYRSGGGAGGPYYQAQQSYNQNPYRDYNNRDYNNRDYNNRDSNNRDFNNRDYNYGRNYDQQGRYDSQGNINNRDRDNYNPQDRDRNYDPQRRNLDPQGRPYDNNNNRPYDPNYPRDYNRPQSQDYGGPRLVSCDDNEASLRRMRNVCLKKVQRIGYDSITVIRRCQMIPLDKQVGTCYDAVARDITLDFCEYCDYDGCNSAHSAKISMFLFSLISIATFFMFNS